jgi:hypothetical protein
MLGRSHQYDADFQASGQIIRKPRKIAATPAAKNIQHNQAIIANNVTNADGADVSSGTSILPPLTIKLAIECQWLSLMPELWPPRTHFF